MAHQSSSSWPCDNRAVPALSAVLLLLKSIQGKMEGGPRRQGMLQGKVHTKRGERGRSCWGVGRAQITQGIVSQQCPSSEVSLHRAPLRCWAAKWCLRRSSAAEWHLKVMRSYAIIKSFLFLVLICLIASLPALWCYFRFSGGTTNAPARSMKHVWHLWCLSPPKCMQKIERLQKATGFDATSTQPTVLEGLKHYKILRSRVFLPFSQPLFAVELVSDLWGKTRMDAW